jgi:endonuclease I
MAVGGADDNQKEERAIETVRHRIGSPSVSKLNQSRVNMGFDRTDDNSEQSGYCADKAQ